MHSDSADIVTDSDGAATDGVVEGAVERANKWRRTMDLLHTSTPRQQGAVVRDIICIALWLVKLYLE